ncbi:hypothetical protein Hanom_Chr04g00368071 [Helianthus anomalus]
MLELRRKVLISGKSVIYLSNIGQYHRKYRYQYSDRYFAPMSHQGTDNRYIGDISRYQLHSTRVKYELYTIGDD